MKKKTNKADYQKTSNKLDTPITPQDDESIVSDPLGSYTGVPEDGGQPIQDADDL